MSSNRLNDQRYGGIAQSAHWLTALLLIGAFAVGYIMTAMAISPTQLKLFSYHKWIGVTIFSLVVLRLLWRLFNPPPPLPAATLPWERAVVRLTHGLLYFLLFAVPLSGWLMSSAKGFQTVYFGVLPIPDLLGKNKELASLFQDIHHLFTKVMLGLIALHVAAAFKHLIIDRDGVMQRMLPRRRRNHNA
jgi:cytochrome b561